MDQPNTDAELRAMGYAKARGSTMEYFFDYTLTRLKSTHQMGNKTLSSRSSPITIIISDEASVANIVGSIMITHVDRLSKL